MFPRLAAHPFRLPARVQRAPPFAPPRLVRIYRLPFPRHPIASCGSYRIVPRLTRWKPRVFHHGPCTGLIRQVEGALARIQLNQLGSLSPAPEQAVDKWHIEIPVLTDNKFQSLILDIEREATSELREGSDTWTVALSVDLAELGWLHARLQLHRGVLNTTLWAEHALTADLASRHLDTLHKSLSASGLELKAIRCHHGCPVESSESRASPPLLQVSA